MNRNKHSPHAWHVFRLYYPNFAGSAVQGRQIFQQLALMGTRISILTAADHLARGLAGQKVHEAGMDVHYLRVIPQFHWQFLPTAWLQKTAKYVNRVISSLSFNLRIAWKLYRSAKPGDILHLHSFNDSSFLVQWFARRKGLHTVLLMTLLGSDDPMAIQSHANPLKNFKLMAFRQAEAVVSLCSAQTESCRSAGVEMAKVHQIPCAVDTQKFKPLEKDEKRSRLTALGLNPDYRHMVFVGAAIERKGIDLLFDSFLQLVRRYGDIALIVVGEHDFSDRSRYPAEWDQLVAGLRLKLARNSLTDRVYWIGKTDEVEKYLQIADVFCFPSRREGFGIVIVEAMAAALPAVVSQLEGVTTDLLQPGVEGFLIAEDDLDGYVQALSMLLSEHEKAVSIGSSARRRAEGSFALDKIAASYQKLYSDLNNHD